MHEVETHGLAFVFETTSCDTIDKATWAISLGFPSQITTLPTVYAVIHRDLIGIFCVAFLSLIGILAVVLDIVRNFLFPGLWNMYREKWSHRFKIDRKASYAGV